jgi:hypothetical protein
MAIMHIKYISLGQIEITTKIYVAPSSLQTMMMMFV